MFSSSFSTTNFTNYYSDPVKANRLIPRFCLNSQYHVCQLSARHTIFALLYLELQIMAANVGTSPRRFTKPPKRFTARSPSERHTKFVPISESYSQTRYSNVAQLVSSPASTVPIIAPISGVNHPRIGRIHKMAPKLARIKSNIW